MRRNRQRRRSLHAAAAAVGLLACTGCGSPTSHAVRPPPSTRPVPAAGPSITSAPTLVAQTADGAVGYRIAGHGPTLVLIMGFSGSMDAWEPAFVDALARDHRVVTFDNAGVGQTAMLAGPLRITAMADQTAALIDWLRLGPTAVLGWSMGGMIAQALAVLHPALVTHLVLAATLPGDGRGTSPGPSVVGQLAGSAQNPASSLALLFPAGQDQAEQDYVAGLVSYPGYYTSTPAVDQAQLGALGTWFAGTDPAGKGLAEIHIPTLVADGTADILAPDANSRTLAGTIPGARLILYPGAGHAFLFQDRAAFVPEIERLLH